MGLDVPQPASWHDAFFGSYPDLAPWPLFFAEEIADEQTDSDGWVRQRNLSPRLLTSTAGYSFDRDRDYSRDAALSASSIVPTRQVLALVGARWSPGGVDATALGLGPIESERTWLVDDEVFAFYTGARDHDRPSMLLCRSDLLTAALTRADLVMWTWFLGEKHYWQGGEPTRKRQELFGAAQAQPHTVG